MKCAGILDPGDAPTLTSTVGWTLDLINARRFDDPTNGDMTVIDFPLTLTMPRSQTEAQVERFDRWSLRRPLL